MPAASMASSGSALKLRPLGSMVMVNVILSEKCEARDALERHGKDRLTLSQIRKTRLGVVVWA
jgi:hypothetical protein